MTMYQNLEDLNRTPRYDFTYVLLNPSSRTQCSARLNTETPDFGVEKDLSEGPSKENE